MRAGHQGNQAGDQRVGTSSPVPTSGERKEAGDRVPSPMANDLINPAYAVRLGLKLFNNESKEASGLVKVSTCQEDGAS